LILVISTAVC